MIINKANIQSLFTAYSLAFQNGLGMAESQYDRISMTVTSSTSENVYPWLGRIPGMREWLGDRVINNLTAHTYAIRNRTFESTVAVRREDVEDDNIGIYNPIFADLGMQATIHPNQLVFGALKDAHRKESLCYDGKPYFAADHPVGAKKFSNLLEAESDPGDPWYLMCTTRPIKPIIFQRRRPYTLTRKDSPDDDNVFMRAEFIYGVDARVNVGYGLWQMAIRSTKPLDGESYAEARALMASYKDENGNPLGLVPNLLVASPSQEAALRKLLVVEFGEGGATNPWKGSADFLISPWLG